MSQKGEDQRLTASAFNGSQRGWAILFVLLVLTGVVTFVTGIQGPQAQRTWQVYLVNFVFWTGLASGAVLFVAILNLTNARWARPIKRLAEAPGAFLPVALILFSVLYHGRGEIFPWIEHPVEGKEAWLRVEFLFARDGLGLFMLTAVAMALLYFSLRGDMRVISRGVQADRGNETPTDKEGGAQEKALVNRSWRAQNILSPVLAVLYALVLSLIAVDLIMSLDPHWYSTLFGAYYFVGSFYTALAALVIMTGLYRNVPGLRGLLISKHFHDLGKLLLGFCVLTGDFFYSQFLVIWYGNLPEDAQYVILRVRHCPWEPLAWIVLVVCFAVPFVALLSRRIKMSPGPMMALAGVILIGMWLERLLLVAPSIWDGATLPIGLTEVIITGGFFGVMALTVMLFLTRFPLLPVSDPLFVSSIAASSHERRARPTEDR
jgi:hypothetical protein